MTQRDFSKERKDLQDKDLAPKWFTTMGWQLFSQKYINGDSKNPRDQYSRIAKTLAKFAPKEYPEFWFENKYFAGMSWEEAFFSIMWDGFLSPSTPLLTNTGTDYGLSVSCSGTYVEDSVLGFYDARRQNAMLTKNGFGTSVYLGDIRSRGSKMKNGEASGSQPVAEMFVDDAMKVSQGQSRRGASAYYYPIDGEDFSELVHYLETYTDGNNAGWCLDDKFRDKLLSGDKEASKRWGQMLSCKGNVGSGYQLFTDKVNRQNPQMYKDRGLEVKASNLCSEITLFSDAENTFTCVLSSENLQHWDNRPDNLAFVGTVFLDCVVSDFLYNAKDMKGLEAAVKFTEDSRALGYGAMAFHTYLLDHNIVWGSLESQYMNEVMFSTIKKEASAGSKWLAEVLGEPELCKGYGVRNTHLLAVAPTKSTALIVGSVSEGINPQVGFVFTQATPAGEVVRIDPSFLAMIREKGIYGETHTPETTAFLNDINAHKGSIQHRPEFTEEEKAVYRTAFEINPYDHLKLVSERQKYVCQSQSTNLFLANMSPSDISKVYLHCYLDERIKSVYYQYGIRDSNIQTNVACSACE
jgi:ribonucleoside-diphosphate reductase alpha chain